MCSCAGYAALFFSGVALGGLLFPPAARSAAAWARAAAVLAAATAAAWLATAALDYMVENLSATARHPPRRPAPASGGDRAKGQGTRRVRLVRKEGRDVSS